MAALLGREALKMFVALNGTAICGQLRDQFGMEEQMILCRELVRQGTRNLVSLLNEKRLEGAEKCLETEKCGSCA